MIKQKSLIGTELDTLIQTIEWRMLKNLKRSLGKNTSETQFEGSAKHEIFPSFLLGQLINMPRIHKALHLSIPQVLLSRESIIAHRPVKVGDTLRIKTFLKDVYEQQATSNPIGFVILDSIGTIDENIAFYCERILAVRGGFTRGH